MKNALYFAKYIVSYCTKNNIKVSNLKLQQLVFILFVEYYNKTKEILFYDYFQAWNIGPVVSEVYYEFCAYGGLPINRIFNIATNNEIINNIISKYATGTTFYLIDYTKNYNQAWRLIYNKTGVKEVIPIELILKEKA